MSIPTEENHINGHTVGMGICKGCRLEVTYTEVALNGVSLSLCRRCAGFVAGWLSADIAVGTRQRGGFEGGSFTQVENTVRTNLRMLSILGITPSDEELSNLMDYARGLLEQAHIKDKVAEKLVEGKGVAETAEELGVHRNAVSYHKKALTTDMSDSVQEYRAARSAIELSELKAQLVSPAISAVKKVELALAIIDREIDLLGTKAPTKSIQARIDADVDPEQLVGYRRFVYSAGRKVSTKTPRSSPVYQFARQLSRPDVIPTMHRRPGIGTLGGRIMRLLEYIKHVKPSYEPDWFHLAIIAELEKVAAGEQSLLVSCGPGHGKTELISILFPSWLVEEDPGTHIISLSNSDGLARLAAEQHPAHRAVPAVPRTVPERMWTRQAEQQFQEKGNDGRPTLHSAGINGQLTGHRAKFLLADDLIKSLADAYSETVRERVWSNFNSAAETRLLPDGQIVMIHTRWSLQDPIQQALDRAKNPLSRQFVYLNFAAVNGGQDSFRLDTRTGEKQFFPPYKSLATKKGTALLLRSSPA